MIDEAYIKELLARPLDLDTDLTDFVAVAVEWDACNDALADLRNTHTLKGCGDDARGDYLEWFFYQAYRRYENVGRWYDAEAIMKDTPYSLASYMTHLPERVPELERILLDGEHLWPLVFYAIDRQMREGWEELEQLLLNKGAHNDYAAAIRYAVHVLKRRWPELEEQIRASGHEILKSPVIGADLYQNLNKDGSITI